MTTGFALTFAFFAIAFMFVGVGFGVLATAIRAGGAANATRFDWGMSFGPVGAVLLLAVAARDARKDSGATPAVDRPRDRARWSPRRAGDMLIVLGSAAIVVSAFLPWLRARSRTESMSFAPASEPALAIGTWIVLASVIIGALVYMARRIVGVVACASAIWFNVSLVYWLLGSTVATWLPAELLPDNLTASVQPGAAVGLAGASLVLTGAAVACSEQTWPIRSPRIESWTFLGGLGVTLVAMAGRNMPWIDITAEDFRWVLAVDAVPGVGDVIGLVLLFLALTSLVTAVSRWQVPAVLTVVAGIATLVTAVVALASGALVERAGVAIADQVVARDVGVDTQVEALLIAPAWFAATGVLAIGVGVVSMLARRRDVPNEGPSRRHL